MEQWIKNLFVFVPIFFAGQIFEFHKLTQTLWAFLIFCFISSAVYILNDYRDRDTDRLHSQKKDRPLASGTISTKQALAVFLLLIMLTVLLLALFGNERTVLIIAAYFLLNVFYSFGLKNVGIIDILIVSFGFVLRVLAGGYMSNIPITDWTIILIFDLALILALGKRRGELLNTSRTGETRKSLSGYNKSFLDSAIIISCAVAIVSYIMFVLSPQVQDRIHHFVIYTFVFVFAGVFKYLQITFVQEKTESPTRLIFENRFLQLTILLWVASFGFLIYMHGQ